MVRTTAFQVVNTGSIPVRCTIRVVAANFKNFTFLENKSNPVLDELSNWLAPQTVNLPPSGHVGSNPTSPTRIKEVKM